VLDSIDESLNLVPQFVEVAIMTATTMASARGNHRLPAGLPHLVTQTVAIVALVTNDVPGPQPRQQLFGAAHVMPLTASHVETYRTAFAIDCEVDFAAKTTTRSSEGLAILTPFAPAACWAGPDDC
jgi:hypothetical protein